LLSEGIPRDKLSTRGNGNGCQKSSPIGSGSMGQLPSPLPAAVT
jgi:hypothetical protein